VTLPAWTRRELPAAFGALAGALFLAVLIRKLGPQALVVPVALAAVVILLARPSWLAAGVVGAAILVEPDGSGFVPFASQLYGKVKFFSPLELLVVALAFAIALAKARDVVPPRPLGPLAWPLGLVGVAVVCGVITGSSNGVAVSTIRDNVHGFLLLLVLPFLLSWVLDGTNALRRAVLVALGLAAFKAGAGLLGAFSGQGATDENGGATTYYEPTAVWLMLLAVLVVAVAALQRVTLPLWARWAAPLSLLAIALSYKRSFWIATVLALALVLVAGTGPTGRRLLVPVVLLVAGAVYLTVSNGVVKGFQGPLADRVESLQTSKLTRNREDRYRLDERRNVLDELRRQPLTGLGLGAPWKARHPLSREHPNGRNYVHMAPLYWALKLGPLGVLAYFWLGAAAAVTGLRVFRRHHDDLVRSGALAAAVGVVALMVAEMTATWTGVDLRLTALYAAVLGFLGAAARDLRRRDGGFA
jgi:hypothetical protein